MQAALIIYNDRINTHRRLVEIDKIIDNKPTPQLVAEMAETRIQNLLCFRELEAFNNTGKFLNRHHLLTFKSERDQLYELFVNDPAKFLHEHKLCSNNIDRYNSRINGKSRTDEQKITDAEHLKTHKARLLLFIDIMKQHRL